MEKIKTMFVLTRQTSFFLYRMLGCVSFYILLFDQLIPDISKHGGPTKVPCF